MPQAINQPVRLLTAKGTVRPRLPVPIGVRRTRGRNARPAPARFLEGALAKRWRAFRNGLRKGIPHKPQRADVAVHDLRAAARRLLSVLAAVDHIGARKAARRLSRRVDDVLERLGPLRDLTVQRELSSRLRLSAGSSNSLRLFRQAIGDTFRRSARKIRRRLAREDLAKLRRDHQSVRRRLKKGRKGDVEARGRRELVKGIRSSFSALRRRRRAVDPTRLDTLHKMRLSLKSFRYQMDVLEPLVPGASKEALQSLHALQTNLGDLHDLEVLSSALAEFAQDEPARAAELSAVLAKLEAMHSGMLQSFLKSADVILDYWQRALATSTRRPSRLIPRSHRAGGKSVSKSRSVRLRQLAHPNPSSASARSEGRRRGASVGHNRGPRAIPHQPYDVQAGARPASRTDSRAEAARGSQNR